MRTKWSMCMAALVLAFAASATGWGDYIFSGATGAFITGEDGNGKYFANRPTVQDTTANTAWSLRRGGVTTVGSYNYLNSGIIAIAGNFGGNAWLVNAIQLTANREFLSVVVYNNSASAASFTVQLGNGDSTYGGLRGSPIGDEGLGLPGQQSDPAYSPHLGLNNNNDGRAQSVGRTTKVLAPGKSDTVTWDLFDIAAYLTLPDLAQPDPVTDARFPRTSAPVAGDWLGELAINVYFADNSVIPPTTLSLAGSSVYLTDVQLTGPASVPEPATLLLLGTGVLGSLGVLRRRRMM